MKNNNFYKSISIRFLGSACFLIAIFALAAFSVQAQIVYSTVQASDPENVSAEALITVFDAQTGRQIANGLTDSETGQFRFAAYAEQTFVVVAMSEAQTIYTNYIGSARGAAGSAISVSAVQHTMSMSNVCYDGNSITLSYTNASGAPLKNAQVSIVNWGRFSNIRRGKTNQQGQYTLNMGDGISGDGFLAVVWKGNGAVSLKKIWSGCGE